MKFQANLMFCEVKNVNVLAKMKSFLLHDVLFCFAFDSVCGVLSILMENVIIFKKYFYKYIFIFKPYFLFYLNFKCFTSKSLN